MPSAAEIQDKITADILDIMERGTKDNGALWN